MIKVSIRYPYGETSVAAAHAACAARSGDGLADVGINAQPPGTPSRDVSRSTRWVARRPQALLDAIPDSLGSGNGTVLIGEIKVPA